MHKLNLLLRDRDEQKVFSTKAIATPRTQFQNKSHLPNFHKHASDRKEYSVDQDPRARTKRLLRLDSSPHSRLDSPQELATLDYNNNNLSNKSSIRLQELEKIRLQHEQQKLRLQQDYGQRLTDLARVYSRQPSPHKEQNLSYTTYKRPRKRNPSNILVQEEETPSNNNNNNSNNNSNSKGNTAHQTPPTQRRSNPIQLGYEPNQDDIREISQRRSVVEKQFSQNAQDSISEQPNSEANSSFQIKYTIAKLNRETEDARATVGELEIQNLRLEQELSIQKQKYKTLQAQTDYHAQQLKVAEASQAKTTQRLADTQKSLQQVKEQHKLEIKTLETKHKDRITEYKGISESVTELNSKLTQQIESLTKRLDQTKQEVANLYQQKLNSIQQHQSTKLLSQQQINRLKGQLLKLQSSLTQTITQNDSLKQLLKSQADSQTTTNMSTLINSSTNIEKTCLYCQTVDGQQIQAIQSYNLALNRELESYRQKTTQLTVQLGNLRQDYQNLTNTHEALILELKSKSTELGHSKSNIQQIITLKNTKLEQLHVQNLQQAALIQKLEDRLHTSNLSSDETQKQLQTLLQEQAKYMDQISQLSNTNQQISQLLAIKTRESVQKQQIVEDTNRKASQLRISLHKLEDTNSDLKEELHRLQRKYYELQQLHEAQIDQIQADMDSMNQKLDLEKEIHTQTHREQFSKLHEKYEEARAAASKNKAEAEQLKTKLQQSRNETHELQQENLALANQNSDLKTRLQEQQERTANQRIQEVEHIFDFKQFPDLDVKHFNYVAQLEEKVIKLNNQLKQRKQGSRIELDNYAKLLEDYNTLKIKYNNLCTKMQLSEFGESHATRVASRVVIQEPAILLHTPTSKTTTQRHKDYFLQRHQTAFKPKDRVNATMDDQIVLKHRTRNYGSLTVTDKKYQQTELACKDLQ